MAIYFDESLLAQPLPQGDWNLAHITQDANNGSILRFARRRCLSALSGLYGLQMLSIMPPLEDEHGNQPLRQNRSQIDGRAFGVDMALVVMSWLPNSSHQLSIETGVHCWINGYGIRPKFLAHLTENNDRVIGYIIEDIEGRAAKIDDLPACGAVLSKLHMTGYLLGCDFTRSSFLILNSGRALITDFGSCERCAVDNHEAFQEEMAELETVLGSTARWHDEVAVAAMTVEMWEHLHAISERDGGIVEAAFNQLIEQGRITILSDTHKGMLYEERKRKGLVGNSPPAADSNNQSKL